MDDATTTPITAPTGGPTWDDLTWDDWTPAEACALENGADCVACEG